jgi:DNA replication and repair protein RecF
MWVRAVTLRDFRGYDEAEVELGPGLTVVSGPNGAGKTNLLEALYYGCTGRSCRTNNEREVLRRGATSARVVVQAQSDDGRHEFSVGFTPGEPKRIRADGALVERLLDVALRPLVGVFLPDRLDLVKGAPAVRRAHIDQLVAALWPARTATRRAYAQALAQRNALIAQIRSGRGSRAALPGWDRQLAEHGTRLMSDRAGAVDSVAELFTGLAAELGLSEPAILSYRPRSRARTTDELAAELSEHLDSDLERGFTGHGPHRDDLLLTHGGLDLRVYGSQGQQRLALLALLLAERDAIGARRDAPPLMLLDDVMSELDRDRRQALAELLRGRGQAVITTTDLEHVPGALEDDVTRIAVRDARVMDEAAVG